MPGRHHHPSHTGTQPGPTLTVMPTATLAPTRTLTGIQLTAVGNWNASQGDGKITPDDIASMAAGYADKMVDRIPVKIGHVDSRFQDADGNPPADGDGNPAYGWIENVRATPDGQKLIGDMVGVPAKLADAMPTAFRNRSVEIEKGRKVGGTTFRALLRAVALLGVSAPAVKGLDDVLALYTADTVFGHIERFHIEDDTPTVHHAERNGADGAGDKQSPILGGTVAVSQAVRKALELADDATDDQINSALTAAGLAALPATDPAAPAAPAAAAPAAAPTAAVPAAAVTADATAVEPALTAEPAAPLIVAASAGNPDVITVDRVSFSALQADAQAGRQARDQQIAAKRDHLVTVALREGRIHPTVVTHYRAMLDKDEAGTAALLVALPAVLPVNEVGHAGSAANLSADDSKAADDRAINTFVRR